MSQLSSSITITSTPVHLALDIDEFTHNAIREQVEHTVSGDGIFDVMMNTATEHLLAQYEGNRIRAENYADAYVQIYQATLQAAVQLWLQKGVEEKKLELEAAQLELEAIKAGIQKDLAQKQMQQIDKQIALADKQIDLADRQIAGEEAKKDLYRRQIEGFDEDYKQKILKIMMDSWAVGFSVAKDSFQAVGIPATMQKVTIDDLYNTYIRTDFDKYTYTRTQSVLNGS